MPTRHSAWDEWFRSVGFLCSVALAEEISADPDEQSMDLIRGVLDDILALHTLARPAANVAVWLWCKQLALHLGASASDDQRAPGAATIYLTRPGGPPVAVGSAAADTQIPPTVLWAARMIGAGLDDNPDIQAGLWAEIPPHADKRHYLYAVLNVCGRTIKDTPPAA